MGDRRLGAGEVDDDVGPLERLPQRVDDPDLQPAQPRDLAGAVVFLASPASDYVHGITLPVDGGKSAQLYIPS